MKITLQVLNGRVIIYTENYLIKIALTPNGIRRTLREAENYESLKSFVPELIKTSRIGLWSISKPIKPLI